MRTSSRARRREVHGCARGRRRVHREHGVLGDGVDPARSWLRLAGSPLIGARVRPHLPQNSQGIQVSSRFPWCVRLGMRQNSLGGSRRVGSHTTLGAIASIPWEFCAPRARTGLLRAGSLACGCREHAAREGSAADGAGTRDRAVEAAPVEARGRRGSIRDLWQSRGVAVAEPGVGTGGRSGRDAAAPPAVDRRGLPGR